jgi:hypothetical protein
MTLRPGAGIGIALPLMLLTLAGWASAQEELRRPEEQLAAIYTLRVQLEIEQRTLDDSLQRHSDLARVREEARLRVVALYEDLDAAVDGREPASHDEVVEIEQKVERAEQDLETLVREGRILRTLIRSTHDRIEILKDRISGLRQRLPADNESLTGTWEVSYLPSGDTGIFTVRQSGTLLVGEYVLEGGWKGSLQGTFVDGTVLLHRIDSKLGRSSDLEGSLSPDGQTIRGRWQNFVLSAGSAANGTWVARKRPQTE